MESKFDLSWDDVALNTNSSKVTYLKVESGKTGARIRIVSPPSLIAAHWAAVGGKLRKVNCAGADCLLCRAGVKVTSRYNFYVLDKTEDVDSPELKVYEAPATVMTNILALAKDKDYGAPGGYDIKIKREGAGKDTRYSVIPCAVTPMTEAEKSLAKSALPLSEVLKPGDNAYFSQQGFDCLVNASNGASTSTEEKTPVSEGAPNSSGSGDDWDF